MVLLTDHEREVLERWLTQMSDRTSLDGEGRTYARLLGKVLDAAEHTPKTAARTAARMAILAKSPAERRNGEVKLPKEVVELLPLETQKKIVPKSSLIVDEQTRNHRKSRRECEVHGVPLMLSDLQPPWEKDKLRCTEFGCEYMTDLLNL